MKSREFFNADNTPEDPKLQRARELEAGERIARERKITEVEVLLDQIDFDLLRDIFKDDIKKTGISVSEINFLRKDRISHLYRDRGAYASDTNIIQIGYDNILGSSEAYDVDVRLMFLEVLIHEETHAVSKTRCWNLLEEKGNPSVAKSGYASAMDQRNETGNLELIGDMFRLFNEGVTQKRAREVLVEYLRRTGYSEKENLAHFEHILDEYDPYRKAIQITEALTRRLAKANGVSEEAAWGAIMRGYYEGEDLLREDFQEWFGETLPPGFMDKLMMADDEDLAELLDEELEQTSIQKAA